MRQRFGEKLNMRYRWGTGAAITRAPLIQSRRIELTFPRVLQSCRGGRPIASPSAQVRCLIRLAASGRIARGEDGIDCGLAGP